MVEARIVQRGKKRSVLFYRLAISTFVFYKEVFDNLMILNSFYNRTKISMLSLNYIFYKNRNAQLHERLEAFCLHHTYFFFKNMNDMLLDLLTFVG